MRVLLSWVPLDISRVITAQCLSGSQCVACAIFGCHPIRIPAGSRPWQGVAVCRVAVGGTGEAEGLSDVVMFCTSKSYGQRLHLSMQSVNTQKNQAVTDFCTNQ